MAETGIRRSSTGQGSRASRPDWVAAVLWRNPRLLARVLWLRANLRIATRRATLSLCGAALLLALGGATDFGSAQSRADTITVVDGEVAIVQNDLCSLIEAIHNANDTTDGLAHADCAPGDPAGADEIVLPEGGQFVLTAADNETYGPSGLPVIDNAVTLSGNGATIWRHVAAEPFRILAVASTGDLTLTGTTLTGGFATYSDTGLPEHFAATSGGSILSFGKLTVRESVITRNEARNDGGGVDVGEGTAIFERATISDNYAQDGGGINNGSQVTLSHSTVSGNRSYTGGGIINYGSLLLDQVVIYDNHGVVGGGINNNYVGTVTIVDSLIHKNGRNGITNNDVMVITGSTITANASQGGITNNEGTLTLVNSTLSGNESLFGGGGLYVRNGTAHVIHSTLTDNRAARGGGAFVAAYFFSSYSNDCFSGSLTVEHSIVSGNEATGGSEAYAQVDDFDCRGEVSTMGNLFGHDGAAGVVNIFPGSSDLIPAGPPADILLPALEWNGGPTKTHALPPGSPAIDMATSEACAAEPVGLLDQRGWARNVDGDGQPSTRECDLGAFEWRRWPFEFFAPVVSGATPHSMSAP